MHLPWCIRRECHLPCRGPSVYILEKAAEGKAGRMTYDLSDHLNILAANDEDAARDVAEQILDVDTLNCVLGHEIAWVGSG